MLPTNPDGTLVDQNDGIECDEWIREADLFRPLCGQEFYPATWDNTCEICVAPVFVPQIKPCWDCFGDQQIPDTFEIFASMAPLPADNQVTHTYQRTTVDKRTNTSAVSTSSWTPGCFAVRQALATGE